MANEYEALARMLMGMPQAGKLTKNLNSFKSILNSPEGQQLFKRLSEGDSRAFEQAAAAALAGDQEKARALFSSLLSSEEREAFAAKIADLSEREHP